MAKKNNQPKTGINPWTLKRYEIKDKNLHPNVADDCPECEDEKGGWDHVKSASKFMTSEAKLLSDKRLAICKECEHSRDMFSRGWINYCNKCGCMLKIKTRIKSNQCPIGKW
jgi:hypothetical protein